MEGLERLSLFIAVLIIMIAWELIAPRRPLHHSRWQRWSVNIGLSFLTTLIMRFTIASAALISASYAVSHNWGLLHLVDLPVWLHFGLGIVLLDLAIYGQHRASHQWSWLWRLHKVHHTDLDFDVTTAVRFHPVEIMLSMCYKSLCILIVGVNPVVVLVFEIILSSCALFNHSNVKIPLMVDKVLRLLLVTPDMHRVHHSTIKAETDSNYGFSISIWDRLFASYTDQPQQGHNKMTIGLSQYQHVDDVNMPQLLLMPFKRDI
ncbi:MAG: sterol desaturase family protein [Gammaproteobacteria bacterium]|nr:sterol desaturase family protein [Gammaproteobacteria bacterium]